MPNFKQKKQKKTVKKFNVFMCNVVSITKGNLFKENF